MKTCPCGVTGEKNFYRHKGMPDGLQKICKICTARQRRETYHRKYPEGRNGGLAARNAKMVGNKRAVKANRKPRYESCRAPRKKASGMNTILDAIIRTAIV